MTRKVGIIYCDRIQDASCVGCAKCYKAVNENTFAFEDQGDVRVVFKTSCGDCPGLVVPKIDLQMTILDAFEVDVDALYFGTCVQKALPIIALTLIATRSSEVNKDAQASMASFRPVSLVIEASSI